jgi:hypothetical protein
MEDVDLDVIGEATRHQTKESDFALGTIKRLVIVSIHHLLVSKRTVMPMVAGDLMSVNAETIKMQSWI